MKLSKREQRVYDAMVAKPEEDWSQEDLREVIFDREPPRHWRATVLRTMLLLCAKTQTMPVQIVKTTTDGRGVKARYAAEIVE